MPGDEDTPHTCIWNRKTIDKDSMPLEGSYLIDRGRDNAE